MYNVLKSPLFQNDSTLLTFNINNTKRYDGYLDRYTLSKLDAFDRFDIKKQNFEQFKDRPSLRNYNQIGQLYGSIYTFTCTQQNFKVPGSTSPTNRQKYYHFISYIRDMIYDGLQFTNNRRCILRFVNNFNRYYSSMKHPQLDVSCLSAIHYFKNRPRIIFRASDIQNQLFTDFITIFRYFIEPVYNQDEQLQLQFYLSTTQNVQKLYETLEKIKEYYW